MQKKFLFTAEIQNDDFSSYGKVFLFGRSEYVFEGLPEHRIYLSLKKEKGKWTQTHGPASFDIYVGQLAAQIEVFLDARISFNF